jgi:hypothetical protein
MSGLTERIADRTPALLAITTLAIVLTLVVVWETTRPLDVTPPTAVVEPRPASVPPPTTTLRQLERDEQVLTERIAQLGRAEQHRWAYQRDRATDIDPSIARLDARIEQLRRELSGLRRDRASAQGTTTSALDAQIDALTRAVAVGQLELTELHRATARR